MAKQTVWFMWFRKFKLLVWYVGPMNSQPNKTWFFNRPEPENNCSWKKLETRNTTAIERHWKPCVIIPVQFWYHMFSLSTKNRCKYGAALAMVLEVTGHDRPQEALFTTVRRPKPDLRPRIVTNKGQNKLIELKVGCHQNRGTRISGYDDYESEWLMVDTSNIKGNFIWLLFIKKFVCFCYCPETGDNITMVGQRIWSGGISHIRVLWVLD